MRRLAACLPCLAILACAPGFAPRTPTPAVDAEPDVGVLVLAHGGSPEWDAAVDRALVGLRARLPTALALGMADPVTLQAGLDSLRSRGVARVAVVRVFVTGSSFLPQTRWLLGLDADPPPFFMHHPGSEPHGPPSPLDRPGLEIATHAEGLDASGHVRSIVAERVAEHTDGSGPWAVALIAHGLGDAEENARLVAHMERALRDVPVRSARAFTLREDWPEDRALARAEIRAWVEGRAREGARVLVVPYRLSGFGPYAEILQGLEYVPGRSFLPHPAVSDWIAATAAGILCGRGWEPAAAPCPRTADGS